MRKITPVLTDEILKHSQTKEIGKVDGYLVKTFRQLVEHIAQLSYKNKDYLLFFRGQAYDFRNKSNGSTFYPSIYRGDYLSFNDLSLRFDKLNLAANVLADQFEKHGIEGAGEIRRKRIIQWSILQHYEITDTPLIDVTQSLRVACSFALLDNSDQYAYVYVFGLPYYSNRISINSEHDLINIRLLSICPPDALRPYFQEGYLVGTDDITTDYVDKSELDLNNRLVAKFKIPTSKKFWDAGVSAIPRSSLYPHGDKVYNICKEVGEAISDSTLTNQHSNSNYSLDFLKAWSTLESLLVVKYKKYGASKIRPYNSINFFSQSGLLTEIAKNDINKIREVRNTLVHHPSRVSETQLQFYTSKVNKIIDSILNDEIEL